MNKSEKARECSSRVDYDELREQGRYVVFMDMWGSGWGELLIDGSFLTFKVCDCTESSVFMSCDLHEDTIRVFEQAREIVLNRIIEGEKISLKQILNKQ